jgi:hypothetical protein
MEYKPDVNCNDVLKEFKGNWFHAWNNMIKSMLSNHKGVSGEIIDKLTLHNLFNYFIKEQTEFSDKMPKFMEWVINSSSENIEEILISKLEDMFD